LKKLLKDHMLTLNNLPSLGKKRKRIGRGGSRGQTSGRGHKGQKARTGGASKVRSTFEGGQTPLVRRLPKRGFSNKRFALTTAVFNLDSLEHFFEDGATINRATLHHQGLLKSNVNLIKILGRGALSKRLIVHADAFSQAAKEEIERHGGSCVINEEMR